MSKTEKIVVAISFLAVLALFQHANRLNYYVSQLDSAMMVDNINTTYSEGSPVSQINNSALKAIDTVASQKAEEVCSEPLREDRVERIEMVKRHAYGILYPLASFRLFASGISIAAAYQALAFVGLLFAVYLYLRKEKLPVLAAILFCVLVVAHPAWSASAFGQFYPDRFFILAGFIYATLVYRRLTGKADHTLTIILMAILTSIIIERAALMVGGFTLVSLILFKGWQRGKENQFLIVISVVALVYAFAYMLLVQQNSDYGSFSREILKFWNHLNSDTSIRVNLEKYLWMNLPYMILALFEWRLALIAFGAMLPNILGGIGGAEKTGWSTHYHSTYFPFLMLAASAGFLRMWRLLEGLKAKAAVLSCLVAVDVYAAMLNPYTLSPLWDVDWSNVSKNAVIKAAGIAGDFGEGASILFHADYTRAVADAIPEGAVVSTMEGMMPALTGKNRVLHFYPLGLDTVEYLAIGFVRDPAGVIHYYGAASLRGEQNRVALDRCLEPRILSAFKLEKTFSPGAARDFGTAVLKRVNRSDR